jgi:predicted Zn-dependent protease
MGQLEFLIANRGYAKAAVRLDELSRAFPFDPDVWDQYAILYADNRYNNPIRYHYGLGSEYIVLGNYKHGLEQYKTALKKKPTNKEDDKIQSIISARIPEIMRAMSS